MTKGNEVRTTAIFAIIAVIGFGLAWSSRPARVGNENDLKEEIVGKPIFANFENPADSSSFQIVKFDEDLAQLDRFEVAKDKQNNLWKLPSYDDYPADAAEQVRDATTPLVGLTVLDIPSFDRGDHALYGVVNPDDKDLSVAESGVGMLVRVKDDKDQVLASLIIGKEVDQAEGQRYVRVPTEDAVYVVELDTKPFTTDFKKWIKGQLLDVRGFDISNIGLRDYALFRTPTGATMQRNFDADLSYDADTSKWALDRMVTYDGPQASDTQLAEGERLNDTALNDLRNSIQDLEIVGVYRKPKGLAADLKADQSLMDNNESLQSLYDRGFYPQERPDGIEIFATGGETIVGTKDGVRYLLRFGESTAKLVGQDDDPATAEEDSGLRRYLLVTTTLDMSKFPQPDLQSSPQTVEEMLALEREQQPTSQVPAPQPEPAEPTEPEPTTSPDPAGSEDNAPTADASRPEAGKPPQPTSTPAATEQPAAELPASDEPVAKEPVSQEPTKEEPTKEEPAQEEPSDEASVDQADVDLDACAPQSADGNEASATASQEPTETGDTPQQTAESQAPATETTPVVETPAAPQAETPAQQPAAPKVETPEELQERLEALQAEIARDNQRKLDERKEKIDAATKQVQELNARFAEWYYVVSDSVYKKLTLSRDMLITTEPPAATGGGPGLPGQPAGLPPGFQLPGNL